MMQNTNNSKSVKKRTVKDRKYVPKENQEKLKILLNEICGTYYIRVSHNDICNLIKQYVKDYDNDNNEFNNFSKLLNLYEKNHDKKFINGLKQKIKGSGGGSGIFESLTSYIRKWEINNSYTNFYNSDLSD